jgi:predicted NBD/HSP70 family sugar kinase
VRLGIDVGGTKTEAVVVDDDGQVVDRVRGATGRGVRSVIETIEYLAGVLADRSGSSFRDFESIGIGIPGQVPHGTTRVTQAVNLGIEDFDLGAELAARLGTPVAVENDVNAAALGARRVLGIETSMAYLNLGTGVAAGIVVDGALVRGSRGGAGEVGHISIDPDGPPCACGQHGCIESFAGGAHIAARWGRGGDRPITDIFDNADRGDSLALEIRAGLVRGLVSAIQVLVLAHDVESVVLGGGVVAVGNRLMDLLNGALAAVAAESHFIASLDLATRVTRLPSGSPAAALGAALLPALAHPAPVN